MCNSALTSIVNQSPTLLFPYRPDTQRRTIRVPFETEWHSFSEIRETIIETHTALLQPETVLESWESFQKILRVYARFTHNDLLGLFNFFMNHSKLSHMQKQFLIDTVQFIRTGHRSMTLVNWEYVLRDTSSYQASIFNDMKDSAALLYLKSLGSSQIIVQWLSHRTGFSDLIGTLRLLTL